MRVHIKQNSFIPIRVPIALAFFFSACKKESNLIIPLENRYCVLLVSTDELQIVLEAVKFKPGLFQLGSDKWGAFFVLTAQRVGVVDP